jgi:hypothetical protein
MQRRKTFVGAAFLEKYGASFGKLGRSLPRLPKQKI